MRWRICQVQSRHSGLARRSEAVASALTRARAAQTLAEDLGDQVFGSRPASSARIANDPSGANVGSGLISRKCGRPGRVEPEVRAREVAALERVERAQREPRELALERRPRARRAYASASRPAARDGARARAGRSAWCGSSARWSTGSARGGAWPTTRHGVLRAGQEALDERGLLVVALDARHRARERSAIVDARVRADALRGALPARLHEQREAPTRRVAQIGRADHARVGHRHARRGHEPVRPRLVERERRARAHRSPRHGTPAISSSAGAHASRFRLPYALGDRERDVERRQLAFAERREQRVRIAEPNRHVPEPPHRGLEQLDGRLGLVFRIEIRGRAGPRRVRAEQIEDESEAEGRHGRRIPLAARAAVARELRSGPPCPMSNPCRVRKRRRRRVATAWLLVALWAALVWWLGSDQFSAGDHVALPLPLIDWLWPSALLRAATRAADDDPQARAPERVRGARGARVPRGAGVRASRGWRAARRSRSRSRSRSPDSTSCARARPAAHGRRVGRRARRSRGLRRARGARLLRRRGRVAAGSGGPGGAR